MYKAIQKPDNAGPPRRPERSSPEPGRKDPATLRAAKDAIWRTNPASAGRTPLESRPHPHPEDHPAGGAFTDSVALDRLKDEFISTISHELRTPLTSVRAALGLIAGGTLSADQEKVRRMMDIAIRNTDRLVHLVNDIFDLEEMSSGKASLKLSLFAMDELMLRGTTRLQSMARKANVRFIIDAGGVEVYADPERILQTLSKLVSNAIHSSPVPGAAPSEVRLTAHNLTLDEALIQVTDQGRGIPADKLESIFDRFRHVDASDSRDASGAGLGLALCRSIVNQHGGQIWATSTLGEGATLNFTLPTRRGTH